MVKIEAVLAALNTGDEDAIYNLLSDVARGLGASYDAITGRWFYRA